MKELNINDFTYDLPADRIALYPLDKRDQSKLLVYRKGKVMHEQFRSLVDFLPASTMLFFNDTKVIPARLHFAKETGASIEVFLLHPVTPSSLLAEAMQAHEKCTWKCTIGNLKRWKDDVLYKLLGDATLEARLVNREDGIVEFRWNQGISFAEIITRSGETPLPPYLKRKPESTDRDRYQTVYAHYEGAVAAPTAGLHFTDEVLQSLRAKGIQTDYLTLHVSAGTFQPVKVQNAVEHPMHTEQVLIRKSNLDNLLKDTFVVPVGTTSMRTLESLYWYGVKLKEDPDAIFTINQHDPYQSYTSLPSRQEAFKYIAAYMDRKKLDILTGETSIYIMPGYTFRVCQGLVTNFHQPGSTLILLVAALVGDHWKNIYQQALENDYRFLSYGDSSLLLP
ncbi:S-adenosylmethionine:tRNA ribosyltransferase-isomerase [Ohtaekwangia koreensis]|uniref:S-adenosylmethionine:tRNA ribosyltransferase-isomerase n=1 Tax=Ohtaekwangia koreensis TaxID=688867 RepID=A0A1T5MFH9_9BACT|nr:S-adenosylmethionine:tRNA ribosyltransferase-isomerase [Ohtaekwangia koreensis]SKC86990.1 S-adenosylmethionine:tRNA ribosyltransferase-isomerase [Ohtaekwangia koreensis]